MNANEYQQLAMRTNDGNATYRLSNMADNYLDDPSIDVGGILNGFSMRSPLTLTMPRRRLVTFCGISP